MALSPRPSNGLQHVQPRPPRREFLPPERRYVRHRHVHGYISIILSGGFEEAGDFGRRTVRAGDALIRSPFSGHANCAMHKTAVLNLPLPPGLLPDVRHGTIDDPDAIVRASETDGRAAIALFAERLTPIHPEPEDWPDLLARNVALDPSMRLDRWASDNGLHPASLARGFGQLYGTTPARYRVEQRARLAWHRLIDTDDSPCAIAYDLGFADQSHLCREVKGLTGKSPGQWRRLRKFKT